MSEESTGSGQVPPGPSGLPVIGNTRELAGNRLQFMAETAREYGDVVSMLLRGDEAAAERMDPDQIADQVLTLLLAGHETTARSLTFTSYLLATHPTVDDEISGYRIPEGSTISMSQ